jgi:hypothetical protein
MPWFNTTHAASTRQCCEAAQLPVSRNRHHVTKLKQKRKIEAVALLHASLKKPSSTKDLLCAQGCGKLSVNNSKALEDAARYPVHFKQPHLQGRFGQCNHLEMLSDPNPRMMSLHRRHFLADGYPVPTFSERFAAVFAFCGVSLPASPGIFVVGCHHANPSRRGTGSHRRLIRNLSTSVDLHSLINVGLQCE